MTTIEPASLELRSLDVTIDQHQVLHDINLQILPGEMFVLLGGAGSGKSTLLRAIAGLDPLGGGEIWIDDRDITRSAVERRGAALMLQTFPLWAHMSVAKNVAFGLRQQRLGRSQVRALVEQELALFGLGDFYYHLPWQLNPSQQQRVALARTLISNAQIKLLDEPFSVLDARLRERLAGALKKRQLQSATTTLLTTQDRNEAMRIADRIALLHEGALQQVGAPMELYDNPRNRYVAEYMGSANLIDGEIEYAGDQPLFRTVNDIVIPLFDEAVKRSRTGSAMFRPHDLLLVGRDQAPFGDQIRLNGRVEQTEFLGDILRYCIDIAGEVVWMDLARGAGHPNLNIGDQVVVGIDPARIRILEN